MNPSKILLVDDNPALLRLIQRELESHDYDVCLASDGNTALELVASVNPDLVVLDINLPGMDGLSVCRKLRSEGNIPILILSSLRQDYNKIVGLEMGADDYLAKPCNPQELVARVRALLRRSQVNTVSSNTKPEVLSLGSITLHPQIHEVFEDQEKLTLTPIEFSLLKVLMEAYPNTLSRKSLLDTIWGPGFTGTTRTIDSHIRNLRKKLKPTSPQIESVRSVGFKLVLGDEL